MNSVGFGQTFWINQTTKEENFFFRKICLISGSSKGNILVLPSDRFEKCPLKQIFGKGFVKPHTKQNVVADPQ